MIRFIRLFGKKTERKAKELKLNQWFAIKREECIWQNKKRWNIFQTNAIECNSNIIELN